MPGPLSMVAAGRHGMRLAKRMSSSFPLGSGRSVVRDKYPAYISWETFERIQAMLQDNYTEYDRKKSRGVPRPGAVMLHGLVYLG